MDTRGQGGKWTTGATRDGAPGPENSLVMTRGVTTPEGYYYTRLFTDAALAVHPFTGHDVPGSHRSGSSGTSLAT